MQLFILSDTTVTVMSSYKRHFNRRRPLSTRVQINYVKLEFGMGGRWGVAPQWTSIPFRGKWKYSELLHASETRLNSGGMGHSDLPRRRFYLHKSIGAFYWQSRWTCCWRTRFLYHYTGWRVITWSSGRILQFNIWWTFSFTWFTRLGITGLLPAVR